MRVAALTLHLAAAAVTGTNPSRDPSLVAARASANSSGVGLLVLRARHSARDVQRRARTASDISVAWSASAASAEWAKSYPQSKRPVGSQVLATQMRIAAASGTRDTIFHDRL
jgi:hypothetical protein